MPCTPSRLGWPIGVLPFSPGLMLMIRASTGRAEVLKRQAVLPCSLLALQSSGFTPAPTGGRLRQRRRVPCVASGTPSPRRGEIRRATQLGTRIPSAPHGPSWASPIRGGRRNAGGEPRAPASTGASGQGASFRRRMPRGPKRRRSAYLSVYFFAECGIWKLGSTVLPFGAPNWNC